MRRERDKAVLENSLLFEYATTDPLTSLLNRRALTEGYNERIFEQKQRRDQWAMLLFDLDHFKQVNDQYGHNAGDLCLVQFAKILEQHCGPEDMCARIGGEEFVILTTETARSRAEDMATRIRLATAAHQFGDEQVQMGKITTSIGVAIIPNSVPIGFDTIYRLADQALYAAKAGGRDRVMVSEVSTTFGKRSPRKIKSHDFEQRLLMINEGRFRKV